MYDIKRKENFMKNFYLVFILVLFLPAGTFAQDTEQAVVQELAKTSRSWDGESLPQYLEGQPEVTVLRITIPPGATLNTHKHPVINAGVLLKGELTVYTEEDEVLNLQAGQAIVEVVDKWHYGRNQADDPAEIIVFYAGVVDTPVTVLDKE
ncbi:MAG: cupin domain-containing protein [Desulfonatronovibrio sp.]